MIFGGTDALAEDTTTVSDALIAVDISLVKFNCKVVAVDQALNLATDMVEWPRASDSSLANGYIYVLRIF